MQMITKKRGRVPWSEAQHPSHWWGLGNRSAHPFSGPQDIALHSILLQNQELQPHAESTCTHVLHGQCTICL